MNVDLIERNGVQEEGKPLNPSTEPLSLARRSLCGHLSYDFNHCGLRFIRLIRFSDGFGS